MTGSNLIVYTTRCKDGQNIKQILAVNRIMEHNMFQYRIFGSVVRIEPFLFSEKKFIDCWLCAKRNSLECTVKSWVKTQFTKMSAQINGIISPGISKLVQEEACTRDFTVFNWNTACAFWLLLSYVYQGQWSISGPLLGQPSQRAACVLDDLPASAGRRCVHYTLCDHVICVVVYDYNGMNYFCYDHFIW